MIEEEIPSALAGDRLDRVVALLADLSRAQSAALIEGGGVSVDGVPAAAGKVNAATRQVCGRRGHAACSRKLFM